MWMVDEMKPILFSTPMVQAILDGRKTMTRRVIKIPSYLWENPTILEPDCCAMFHYGAGGCQNHSSTPLFVNSKYQVGDVLWVRETWGSQLRTRYGGSRYFTVYRADYKEDLYHEDYPKDMKGAKVKWKPSIHMPKECARIFLRVTNIRVERLQDIEIEDIENEGFDFITYEPKDKNKMYSADEHGSIDCYEDCALEWWQNLWNSTSKEGYKWEANPYVFVYEFERIDNVK